MVSPARLYASALLAILPLLPSPALSQVLWGEASVGMSQQEVLRAVPGSKPADGTNFIMRSGNKLPEKARLEGVQLVGRRFKASYFFDDAGLRDIRLSSMQDVTDCDIAFANLRLGLKVKYGDEAARMEEKEPYENRELLWSRDGTVIRLQLVIFSKENCLVAIDYSSSMAIEAGKL